MNNLKLFLRSLDRNRVHSVITIVGFAVSMAVVLLLMAYIKSERSYNRHYPNIDRTYLVVREDNSAAIPEDVYSHLSNDFPEIESVTMWDDQEPKFQVEKNKVEGRVICTDENFLKVFSVKLLQGKVELNSKGNVLITRDFADKLFGDANPFGKPLTLWGSVLLTVTGIIETPSPYSGIQYDALMPRDGYKGGNYGQDDQGTMHHFVRGALLLREGTDPEVFRTKISVLSVFCGRTEGNKSVVINKDLDIRPFRDTYFDTSVSEDHLLHANVSLVHLLYSVTLVIIVLAILNYINLTTARGMQRLKEVGIRKTIGASKQTIFGQFMTETYLVFLLSVVLAYGLATIGKPLFESFLGKAIDLRALFSDPLTIGLLAGVFLITGLLAGIIPALSASGFKPILLLNHAHPSARGYGLRGIMNVFQFASAIALIIVLLLIMRQVNYVKNIHLGFDQEQLVRVNVGYAPEMNRVMMEKLLENPMIVRASFTDGGPGNITGSSGQYAPDGKGTIDMAELLADTGFLSTFGIKLLKSNGLSSEGYLINETLYKQIGIEDFEEIKRVFYMRVSGVMQDFHFADLHQPIGGVRVRTESDPFSLPVLNLRIRPENVAETVAFIRETFRSTHPDLPFEYKFYDEWFDSMYQQDENQAAAIRIFAVLAILISCMGLFGLAEFQARRKIKEIGIRKVNGGRVSEIMVLLNKAFVWWVLVAFIIACPIAGYAMSIWLETFAYKAPLSWWIFALAGVLALGIALITVSWQSWKAATRNPVESLRYE